MGPPEAIESSGCSVIHEIGPEVPAALSVGPLSAVCTLIGPEVPATLSGGPLSAVCHDARYVPAPCQHPLHNPYTTVAHPLHHGTCLPPAGGASPGVERRPQGGHGARWGGRVAAGAAGHGEGAACVWAGLSNGIHHRSPRA